MASLMQGDRHPLKRNRPTGSVERLENPNLAGWKCDNSNFSILRKIDALKAVQRSTGFAGEADAASAAIQRLQAKLRPEERVQRVSLLGTWQRTAWLLLLSGMKWSERERDFLESMRCKRSAPSERQSSWLKDLKAKGGWRYE